MASCWCAGRRGRASRPPWRRWRRKRSAGGPSSSARWRIPSSTASSPRRARSCDAARSAATPPDFASGLRDALREDPDVLLVGEMRDPETIGLALTAAETGHLVLVLAPQRLGGVRRGAHRRRLPARAAGADPRPARGLPPRRGGAAAAAARARGRAGSWRSRCCASRTRWPRWCARARPRRSPRRCSRAAAKG